MTEPLRRRDQIPARLGTQPETNWSTRILLTRVSEKREVHLTCYAGASHTGALEVQFKTAPCRKRKPPPGVQRAGEDRKVARLGREPLQVSHSIVRHRER